MADYGYSNAHIRGMKSHLLKKSFFEQLLEAKDENQYLDLLRNTPYREDLEVGMVRFSGVLGIEEGLKINLIKTFRKVLKYTELNEQSQQLTQVILGRWDVHNLKTIFRGLHAKATREEVSDQLVPAGVLDEAHLAELVTQTSVKACIDMLTIWRIPYSVPLNNIYQRYSTTNDLVILELSIDRYYFEHALKMAKGRNLNSKLVQEIISREIDLTNIMILLRLSGESVEKTKDFDISVYFIEGGKQLTIEKLVKLYDIADVEKIVEALSGTIYYPVLKEGMNYYFVRYSLADLERRLEEYTIKKSVALFNAQPLSIAVIAAFIWAKYNETVNLRILIRGKDVGMPEKSIREALVIV